jgi:hypothetical protein
MKWLTLVIVALIAGCADAGEVAEPHNISGRFTTDRTQEDITAFGDKVAELGGDWVLMESWPEEFGATLPSQENCNLLRDWIKNQTFINQSGGQQCQKVEITSK